ncbi:AAA family ATPase [Stenotrophomonas sp.]|uniref:AAA family ATPase n=1 Tax=Stenotrophomonas sp. TaxID=69392 RepID=UPI0028ACF116|nr:AAA family ATPase [Stenotrophomonas sp.]
MIYIDKGRVPLPISFHPGGKAERERVRAEAFYLLSAPQKRFIFSAYRSQDVVESLSILFHDKCAYCETRVGATGPLDVELYRPKGGVAESPSHPGYWWLAADWQNLLLSCADCNRQRKHRDSDQWTLSGKANRFPLADETKRVFDPSGELDSEEPVLLNPCVDEPQNHLIFDWNGKVTSDTIRGQTTIAVLGLNRYKLVDERARVARDARFKLELIAPLLKARKSDTAQQVQLEQMLSDLLGMTADSAPYAGMTRQLLQPDLSRILGENGNREDYSWLDKQIIISRDRRSHAKNSYQEFEKLQSSFSLSDKKGRERSMSQRRDIERISVRNFKGIRSVDIDLVAASSNGSWLMLLGENSAGKSSILQAISLCLAGADYFATLVDSGTITPDDLINANTRTKKATVLVKMTGFAGDHKLTITHEGAFFTRPSGKKARVQTSTTGPTRTSGDDEARQVQVVLLCYGATRLLPKALPPKYGQQYARIDNLFDPFLPLLDAETWLAQAKKSEFDEVALALKDLLALDSDATLKRLRGKVFVNALGERAPIRRLSDGFQSVLAMSIDMLDVAVRMWGGARNAEGIVLLDEIGAHLHPTWKMRIVESLRRAFPGMQFIATTHDPLCLRGLEKGEVVVMKRGEDHRIEAVSGLPSPSDFRVDQLLTSEFFGLNSTTDLQTEEEFDKYYALLALPERTREQTEQIEALKEKLERKRLVGDTLREQLMFEAIDRIIATHSNRQRASLTKMKQEAAAEIGRMWDETVTSVLEGT